MALQIRFIWGVLRRNFYYLGYVSADSFGAMYLCFWAMPSSCMQNGVYLRSKIKPFWVYVAGINGVKNLTETSFFIFMDCWRCLPRVRQRTNVRYKQGTRCFFYKEQQKITFLLGASESSQNTYYKPFAHTFIRLYVRKTPEPLNGFSWNLVVEFRKWYW